MLKEFKIEIFYSKQRGSILLKILIFSKSQQSEDPTWKFLSTALQFKCHWKSYKLIDEFFLLFGLNYIK